MEEKLKAALKLLHPEMEVVVRGDHAKGAVIIGVLASEIAQVLGILASHAGTDRDSHALIHEVIQTVAEEVHDMSLQIVEIERLRSLAQLFMFPGRKH